MPWTEVFRRILRSDLLALVAEINVDQTVHGILVQLPLPKHINPEKVLSAIDPSKDVDGFHPINVDLLASGQIGRAFIPCTPLGCLPLLEDSLGNLAGKNALVIGRSNIVGKPLLQLLLRADCTVMVLAALVLLVCLRLVWQLVPPPAELYSLSFATAGG